MKSIQEPTGSQAWKCIFLCLSVSLFVASGFGRNMQERSRTNGSGRIVSAASTLIDTRMHYDRDGKLAHVEMGLERSYTFDYPDRRSIRVRYKQGPSYEHPFTEEAFTITTIDASGRIKLSRSCSAQDTTDRSFSYNDAGKICFELSVQKGFERMNTRIDERDTSYVEFYAYVDSTVYSWKDSDLEAMYSYRDGKLASGTFYSYDSLYSGHQHAPYNSGFSMLPSVMELCGLTFYGPFLSKHLKKKEVVYSYGLKGDTLSMVTAVYGRFEVDLSGRLTAYHVEKTEESNGHERWSGVDEFTINYQDRPPGKYSK